MNFSAKNVGSTDKFLRAVLGTLLMIGALLGYGVWMWIGLIPLATALIGSCPIYSLLGISTCSVKK
ncbi:MAG: DUF2892 domain-containing protein [Pseudomonadota bacterium]|jgi:hypothetical protein|uniref:Inner membrane protein YgaP-like transmembrane domain-containing protein n=1 Tax=Thalassovita autumnalis TaxID=2072972 RepID=A0A0P1FPJ5_9RHOB|nr:MULTISPECIES: DUF2892 domain-containing protein [Thalassovita]MEC7962526.1 DUF2892 domain-containing protein [Pseudomonadota bacterium]MEC8295527.1 DUF2892 domain-containing protein [Pseudomonadota bacterium]CUH65536.1 hypothetical protein TL5118_01349 [Thalassovita autumnalis]CUH70553.1 hypothetical protein TL5120_00330 [Thalassovita autumnalis]